MKLQDLATSFCKKHPEIDFWDLISVMACDPTKSLSFDESGTPNFHSGKYSIWIGNLYVDGKINVGDIPELSSALVTFDKNKSQLKPIKEVNDLDELIDLVKDLSDDFKPTRCISKGEQGLEKVYEDDEWTVYIPHTFEASRKIGGDTHWCTAASDGQERFDYYTSKGPLYVNIRKSDGEKFQFHFETSSFMDKENYLINLKILNLGNGIVDFYNKISKGFPKPLVYNVIHERSCGLRLVGLNGQANYIDDEGNLLLEKFVDFANHFKQGDNVAIIGKSCKDGCFNTVKLNFIDVNGHILYKTWFDEAYDSSCGYAGVRLNGKWNFINYNADYISEEWFDEICSCFVDNFAIVRRNKKCNIIDIQGEFLLSFWVDAIYYDHKTYIVKIGQTQRIFDLNSRELSQEKYLNIYPITDELCIVSNLKKRYNVINKCTNEYIFDAWQDYIYDYSDYLIVKQKGKYTLMNYDGSFILGTFNELKGLNDHLMIFKTDGKYYIIDNKCNILYKDIVDCKFTVLSNALISNIIIKENGKWRQLNFKGRIVADDICNGDVVSMLNNKMIKLVNDNCSKYIGLSYLNQNDTFDKVSRESKIFNCIYTKQNNSFCKIYSNGCVEYINRTK